MKLSTAMMLGSTTCKMVMADWNSCALGAAANAVGIKQNIGVGRIVEISREWPWLEMASKSASSYCADIFTKFDYKVCCGKMTFEQLVDYVRSIEPACGECNEFTCTCKPAEIPKTEEVLIERSA